MNNFYDPWAHAINILVTRIIQFLLLSMSLGFMVWVFLLHFYFGVGWGEIPDLTRAAVSTTQQAGRAIFRMAIGIGVICSAWLFSCLIFCGRLREGDRFHRGARVIRRNIPD